MYQSDMLASASLVVLDLDGTLYDQRKLRLQMAMEMAKSLPWSATGRQHLSLIKYFREVREHLAESEADDVINRQYRQVAAAFNVSEEEVRAVTDEWLLRRPLPYMMECRAPYIEDLLERLRRKGKKIAVLSDFPAQDKLDALGLRADLVVAATDSEINCFKPNPKGLLRILSLTGTMPSECLVIGDRDDRDGECARRAGASFILKKKSRRNLGPGISCYSELLN